MAKVHVLYWFDVEDCSVPQSDDCARRLALILTQNKVRGTMKVVGQKGRLLEQRLRYKVVDALREHDIGFHSDLHGWRPQIAEYLGALDWDEGTAEFERREQPGLDAVKRVLRVDNIVTYGQPGCNWAPHPFPVLRKWGIPTYISGFGYVGVDCQPFWYGGVLCTSHMKGRRFSGELQNHLMGLNFELGRKGELEKHKECFSESLSQLSKSGGLISIINHPCTLVMKDWFSAIMKSRKLTEAGFEHFENFVKWSVSHRNVASVCGSRLRDLYPDLTGGRAFGREELLSITEAVSGEINFVRLDNMTLSAAEVFGLITGALNGYLRNGKLPREVIRAVVYNPRLRGESGFTETRLKWADFCDSVRCAEAGLRRTGEAPHLVEFSKGALLPGDYLAAAARVLNRLLKGEKPPAQVSVERTALRFEDYVDENAARSAWGNVMMLPGFTAPKLLELAKVEAWTLKPAVLRG